MLRMSKLTDYGTLILAKLSASGRLQTATELAEGSGIALPTVSKVLKALTRADLISSVRGAAGGYRLTRNPEDISAAAILDALEGPVSLTQCSAEKHSCRLEAICTVGQAWRRVNHAIRHSLEEISLLDLQHAERIDNSIRIDKSPPGSHA